MVFFSGIYHIYKAGTRHQDYETIIGKLFEMYGMSRELYTDLAAKLIVLRTLTHTLSVLAAVVRTDLVFIK